MNIETNIEEKLKEITSMTDEEVGSVDKAVRQHIKYLLDACNLWATSRVMDIVIYRIMAAMVEQDITDDERKLVDAVIKRLGEYFHKQNVVEPGTAQ